MARYDTLLVEDKNKEIPECIKHLISEEFYNTLQSVKIVLSESS